MNKYFGFLAFEVLIVLNFINRFVASTAFGEYRCLELFSTCDLGKDSLSVSLLAIRSWISLTSVERVTVFQQDPEACEILVSFFEEPTFRCIILDQSTENETLRVDHLFEAASHHTATPYVGYINCDIAVFSEFDQALKNILRSDRSSKSVIVGRRRDISLSSSHFDSFMSNISLVHENAVRYGDLHGSFGKDYFIFPREFLNGVPPFLVGRPKWDDWFLTKLLLEDPYNLSIYRLDDRIPVVHMKMGQVPSSHDKFGARKNEELFYRIWKCQPISDILNVQTVVSPANCSEKDSFQMTESAPNSALQLLFARKSHCNETLYLYEDLSVGAEFPLSFRKIAESCKQCIHIVHTLTACIYCRMHSVTCICMQESETNLWKGSNVVHQQTKQLELLRRRFHVLSTAIENGYKVNYQIGGKLPRGDVAILKEYAEDVTYTKDFLLAIGSSYEFPPRLFEFVVLKPSDVAREFLNILYTCILRYTSSSLQEESTSSPFEGQKWRLLFKKCVEESRRVSF